MDGLKVKYADVVPVEIDVQLQEVKQCLQELELKVTEVKQGLVTVTEQSVERCMFIILLVVP